MASNIDILITAQDQYSKVLDDAKRRVRDLDLSVPERAVRDVSGFVDQFAKSFAAIGGAKGALDVATAAVQLFRGQTEQAVETLEKLPFGVGKAIKSAHDLIDVVTDLTATLEALAAAEKKVEDAATATGKAGAAADDAAGAVHRMNQATADRVQLLQSQDEFDRAHIAALIDQRQKIDEATKASAALWSQQKELAEAHRAEAAALRAQADEYERTSAEFDQPWKIRESARRLRVQARDKETDADLLERNALERERTGLLRTRDLLEQETSLRLAEIDRQKTAAESALEDRLKREREAIARQSDNARARERERVDSVRSIEAEILEIRLRTAGKEAEAQRVAIREQLRQRLEAARLAGDAETEAALKRLQAARLAAVIDRVSPASNGGIQPFESRFLNAAPQRFFADANRQQAARLAELKQIMSQSKEVAIKQLAALDWMKANTTLIQVENN